MRMTFRFTRYTQAAYLIPLLIVCMMSFSNQQSSDLPQGVVSALKNGDASALSQFFNPSLELVMPAAQDDIYSKQQAELIVRDFFTKYVPTNFVVLHQGGPAESPYAIGTLTTKSGSYRVTVLIKLKDNKPFIHQLRFEQENAD